MKVEEKLKKFALDILKMPLWKAIFWGFLISFFVMALRYGYHEVRYHSWEVVKVILFWVIFISLALLINFIAISYGRRKNK